MKVACSCGRYAENMILFSNVDENGELPEGIDFMVIRCDCGHEMNVYFSYPENREIPYDMVLRLRKRAENQTTA